MLYDRSSNRDKIAHDVLFRFFVFKFSLTRLTAILARYNDLISISIILALLADAPANTTTF